MSSRFDRSESRQGFRNCGVPKLLASFATEFILDLFLKEVMSAVAHERGLGEHCPYVTVAAFAITRQDVQRLLELKDSKRRYVAGRQIGVAEVARLSAGGGN